MKPIIAVVDDEIGDMERIHKLRQRRYSPDYHIHCERDPEPAIKELEIWQSEGRASDSPAPGCHASGVSKLGAEMG